MSDNQNKGNDDDNLIAAIGYIGVLCFVPLMFKKKSEFAQFHGKQGLVLFIAEVVGMFVFWVPLIGQVLALILFILSVVGFIKAYNGEKWEMPIVKDFVKKLKI
jgi:uncharacterized membrane protein